MAAIKSTAKKTPKGQRMTMGKGYTITYNAEAKATLGTRREFSGTLKGTFNVGTVRFALFSVPKNF
jgi:hypothetical protein